METSISFKETYQLILASDGIFSYVLFGYSYMRPDWGQDQNGKTPITGILARVFNLKNKKAAKRPFFRAAARPFIGPLRGPRKKC